MTALNFPNAPTLGQIFDDWTWDGAKWVLHASPGGGASGGNVGAITGEIREFASIEAVPTDWLILDGVPKSRTTYAALFAKIGTKWGVGDGTTTFGIPNMVGSFSRGSDATGSNVGAVGGSANAIAVAHTHTLGAGSAAAGGVHNHGLPQGVAFYGDQAGNTGYIGGVAGISNHYTWNMGKSVWYDAAAHTHTLSGSTDSAGASGTNANLPPFATVVKAIYAGTGGGSIGSGSNPVGTIIDFYGSSAPAGHLVCDGSTFNGTTYPLLAAHLGGTTLPDLRDRSTIGVSATAALGVTKGSANSSVPQHQHSENFSVQDHTHPFTSGTESATHIHNGNANGYWLDGPPNYRIFNTGTQVGVNSVGGVTTLANETSHTHSGTTGSQSSGVVVGAIGDVTGATAAVAGSNYHPVMAVLKCMKAVA